MFTKRSQSAGRHCRTLSRRERRAIDKATMAENLAYLEAYLASLEADSSDEEDE